MYKSKEARQAYVKQWRAKRVSGGFYGQCKLCKGNLGRNEGRKVITNICRRCSKGKNNACWKGGYISSDGYRVIRHIPGKTILEHRYVMEQHLGRKLLADETVHHLNGVRTDNRIENLELWVGAPIRGIRVPDAVKWAKEIIKRYNI